MSARLRQLFDIKLLKFLMVGVANTVFSGVVMFGLYRMAGLGYWWSSAIAYVLGALLSYLLNRRVTFKDQGSVLASAARFAATIAVCYLFAFSLAKPLVSLFLTRSGASTEVVDQVAMGVAMVLYTGANYLAQRFFVFRQQDEEKDDSG